MPYIGKTTDGFGIRERFTYLASAGATSISGADANGAKVFTPQSQVTVNNENFALQVATVSNSFGGSEKETEESIRTTAPFQYATQNRAVTQADYENIAYRMHSKFGSIKRVSVQRDPDSQKRNLNKSENQDQQS